MSKFFKALEQAERDGAEQVPQAPVEAVSQRPSVMTRWPEPPKEEPPRAPSPVDEPTTPPAESPRPVFEPPRPVFKSPRPVVQSPRVASALLDEHLVSLQAPSTAAAEQYRVLRHLVETLRKRTNLQILAVTSPGVGDGKSVTAINLAGALAQSPDARVLLADMDLRRPAVARYLALGEGRPSLAEALGTPGIALKDAVVQVPSFNLSVLRAPASVAAPYELLRSPRLEALLAEARQEYDYVVIDTPPFVPVPDCRVIAKSVDGFVVVVASNRTQRGLLAETLKTMDPDKAVGFVFNAHPTLPTPYYDYGNGHGKTSSWRRMGGTS
jgi:capsular exopolysaccharide synthesis family protein